MAHAFDVRSFEHLLGDAERLAERALGHEQRLAALVTQIEQDGRARLASVADRSVPTAAHRLNLTPGASEWGVLAELLSTVRELCITAREQREFAQAILTRLVGHLAHADGRGPRLLVVEDSHDTLDLLVTVLEASGFQVITAGNGLEGVIVAHYARPAAVLMDLRMPVLDGIEATRLIKASFVTRHLPVIAHTANADVYEGPLQNLFADVLRKPADPDAIVATIQRFVESDSPAEANHAIRGT